MLVVDEHSSEWLVVFGDVQIQHSNYGRPMNSGFLGGILELQRELEWDRCLILVLRWEMVNKTQLVQMRFDGLATS